jgi:hypothetical protein
VGTAVIIATAAMVNKAEALELTPLDDQPHGRKKWVCSSKRNSFRSDCCAARRRHVDGQETNIVGGTIFSKLVMVSEHAEMVQRVEINVDDANTNVNLSMTVLTDTLGAQNGRTLAMWVFSILVVFSSFLFIIGLRSSVSEY